MRYHTPGKERWLLSYLTGTHTFKTNGRSPHIGSGGPINRPITPNSPNSRITSSSPLVSTISAINGKSMLLAARKIASLRHLASMELPFTRSRLLLDSLCATAAI